MPAEYAIDWTGFGKLTGLQRMGEIKVSLAQEAEEDFSEETIVATSSDSQGDQSAAADSDEDPNAVKTDQLTVQLNKDESMEIKLAMKEGSEVKYDWSADSGEVVYDIHGDASALDISYHNYSKGTAQTMSDSLVAAFDGSHGWYWRNRNDEPVTITLNIAGVYSGIKQYR
jgi:hypothetical protein